MLGLVDPENLNTTVGIGFIADMGQLSERTMLEANLNYWSQSESIYSYGEISMRDLTLGAKAKYFFPTTNTKLNWFAGAGLSLHFLKGEVTVPEVAEIMLVNPSYSESDVKLGLDLGGGMTTPINEKADFIGELWYGVVSDVNQLSLRLGVMYKLGI